jgi:tetratricopeptide (TPR) repeat protein
MSLKNRERLRADAGWIVALAISLSTGCGAAESFTADQLALFDKCQTSTPATQVRACSTAIDSKLFKGIQLAGLHVNRANAYDVSGDKDSALKDYDQALELAPDNAEIYYNRGVLFVSQENYNAALKDYNVALRINPAYVAALYNRGRLFAYVHNHSAALTDYSEAIRLDPSALLYQERGSVYVQQHDFQRALDDENAAIRLDPSIALAYFFRSMAYGGLGAGDKASADVRTAIHLDPKLAQFIKMNGQSVSPAPAK